MNKPVRSALVAVVAGTSAIALLAVGHASASQPTCTFDGGGTITNGSFATTTQNTTWVCSSGELIRVTVYVPRQPVLSLTPSSLPGITVPIPAGVAR
jgi:hypothetical protein